MWEIECHDWAALRGRRPYDVRQLLERVSSATDRKEWDQALQLINFYSSDNGIPSEATPDVVACLVAIAVRAHREKRSALLGLLEELTCGLGIEIYTPEQMAWHKAAVRELGLALHSWAQWAESEPIEEARVHLCLLSYCSVYVPALEARVERYFHRCLAARPELGDEIAALRTNASERKELLRSVAKR